LARGKSQPQMVSEISEGLTGNLSSTIRLYVLRYYRQKSLPARKEVHLTL
jgi:predicted DNA-binding ribbon-helix-helix protein